MPITEYAYPRAGLIGNPSDGFYGKTIAFTFSDFAACVCIESSDRLQIFPHTCDIASFDHIEQLVQDIERHGYDGGVRLLKASIKRFYDYCSMHEIHLPRRNFALSYDSSIPRQVGLAGSSAIVIACLRALTRFFGVRISRPAMASLALSVEVDELGVFAGLQDRVAQVYEGLTYMDFSRERVEQKGYGRYEQLDVPRLPPLYVAYRYDFAEESGNVHADVHERFLHHDEEVLEAVERWKKLTDQARQALEKGAYIDLAALMDANFDVRRCIYPISRGNLRMIEAARSVGASAKFTGSGGAIVGTVPNEKTFPMLCSALEPMNVRVLRPQVRIAVPVS